MAVELDDLESESAIVRKFEKHDPDHPFVVLQLSYLNGKAVPVSTWGYLNGEPVRIKAEAQPDGHSFQDYFYSTKDEGWVAVDKGELAEPMLVRGVGSSDIQDAHGDTMHRSALESMCRPKKLTTYIGHKMDDDHVFGMLTGAPVLTMREPDGREIISTSKATKAYAAVELESSVDDDNMRAVRMYRYMKKGHQFGFSVGCYFTKFKRKSAGRGHDVFEVDVAEWSAVTMPACQQAWVDISKKAFMRKGLTDAYEVDAAYIAASHVGVLTPDGMTDPENLYRLKTGDFEQFGSVMADRLQLLADVLAPAGIVLAAAIEE